MKISGLKRALVLGLALSAVVAHTSYAKNLNCNASCTAYAAKHCNNRGVDSASASQFNASKNQAECTYTCNNGKTERSSKIPCSTMTS